MIAPISSEWHSFNLKLFKVLNFLSQIVHCAPRKKLNYHEGEGISRERKGRIKNSPLEKKNQKWASYSPRLLLQLNRNHAFSAEAEAEWMLLFQPQVTQPIWGRYLARLIFCCRYEYHYYTLMLLLLLPLMCCLCWFCQNSDSKQRSRKIQWNKHVNTCLVS